MSWGVALRNAVGLGLSGIPSLSSGNKSPTLQFNFRNTSTLSPLITFTRASNATYFDSTGTLQTATSNTPRFDYSPSTLESLGLLIESQRTNGIRNSTAAGGSAGVLPTNWTSNIPIDGLTMTISAPGVESGITYIDLRIQGTTTLARATINLVGFENTTTIAALSGQTWTSSAFVKLQAGSLSGFNSVGVQISERAAAGTNLASSGANFTPTSASLASQRRSVTRLLTNASTAFVTQNIILSYPLGAVIDATFRVGLPQTEQGAFASSPIQTSTTALTRAADSATVTGANFSSWFNNVEGSFVIDFGPYGNGGASVNAGLFQIDNGTSTESIRDFVGSAVSPVFQVSVGGVNQAYLSAGTLSSTAVSKIASSYQANYFAKSANGAVAEFDASGSVPTVSNMILGSGSGGVTPINGYLRSFSYYSKALSNQKLQSLST